MSHEMVLRNIESPTTKTSATMPRSRQLLNQKGRYSHMSQPAIMAMAMVLEMGSRRAKPQVRSCVRL
jgi:hypothetical protein